MPSFLFLLLFMPVNLCKSAALEAEALEPAAECAQPTEDTLYGLFLFH